MELIEKILKIVEGMGVIESFLVLPVAAFNFTVVPGSKGADGFVNDAEVGGSYFEEIRFRKGTPAKLICEFGTIVGLNTPDGDAVLSVEIDGSQKKDGGRIGALFLESHQEAQSRKLVDGGVLVEGFSRQAIGAAGGWNELDIELEFFTRIGHGSIRFGFVGLRGWFADQMHSSHHTVKADNVANIASVP